jgi:hypothetical protein
MKTLHKIFLISFGILCLPNFSFLGRSAGLSTYFPDIEGFTAKGSPAIYDPDNLYNIIDGAADVYLDFEFRELATQTYEKNEDESLIIEIYRHENPDYGFGIYSHERVYGVSNFVDVGTQGYYEEGILNFFKGSYYVKMRAYGMENEESALLDIARSIDAKLPGENSFPEEINELPFQNRTFNRERFVPRDFLGYPFFKMAFSASYFAPHLPMGSFTFFILRGESADDCRNMLMEYRRFLELPEEEIREGRHTFDDPYYGTMAMLWEGNRIKGMYGIDDEEYIARQFAFNRSDYLLKADDRNVAYRKKTTSSSNENQRLGPENAVDNDLMTRWSSAWSDPQWISIDLEKEYTIDKFRLYWEGAYGTSYNIETSPDGKTWREIYATAESDGEIDEIEVEPVKARYVRINGLSRATEYGYSLYELQIFKNSE